MKEIKKFVLEVEIEVDGKRPSDDVLIERLIEAMNDVFPGVAFDDDELDCAVFVNYWCYEEAEDLNIGKCKNCGHEHKAPNVKLTGDQQTAKPAVLRPAEPNA